jgi:hypothetical protein
MTDPQKQLLYISVTAGDKVVEDLTGAELKSLKTHWFDGNNEAMPPIAFDVLVRDELRRRERQGASKPIPIDHEFYKR